MAYISFQPSDYFNTKLYTGTGAELAVSSVGFQPDWVWLKDRSSANSHVLTDAVRGATKELKTNTDSAEATNAQALKSFDSDGFTLGTTSDINTNTNNYVAWNWKANGSGSSNYDGSITSTVSASTTSGFSVVTYTGAGSTSTVGHGLGVAPKVVLIKGTSNTGTWGMYHSSLGETKKIIMNTNAASVTSGFMNNTAPTSSVFSVINDADVGSSGYTYVAYCFAEKKGFSKFGTYTGNANDDGPFLYTGFKPAFLMTKRTDSTGNWMMWDNGRNTYNGVDKYLFADTTAAEGTVNYWDFTSNGCKNRNAAASGNANASGGTYIYMAFAEHPLVSSNDIPATAR